MIFKKRAQINENDSYIITRLYSLVNIYIDKRKLIKRLCNENN